MKVMIFTAVRNRIMLQLSALELLTRRLVMVSKGKNTQSKPGKKRLASFYFIFCIASVLSVPFFFSSCGEEDPEYSPAAVKEKQIEVAFNRSTMSLPPGYSYRVTVSIGGISASTEEFGSDGTATLNLEGVPVGNDQLCTIIWYWLYDGNEIEIAELTTRIDIPENPSGPITFNSQDYVTESQSEGDGLDVDNDGLSNFKELNKGTDPECVNQKECVNGDIHWTDECGHSVVEDCVPPLVCIDEADSCVGCRNNADCDDGLYCNGAETCDLETTECMSGTNPCPDDGFFCTGTESCNETTNQCVSAGNPCPNDGQYCNGVESCDEAANQCEQSGNPCPDDGLFCTGTESCNETTNQCVPGVDPCTPPSVCNEATNACVGCLDNGDCDDGLFCNGAETCSAGVCQPGANPCPDDGLFCTGTESCDEGGDQCLHSGDPCSDDGQFCNGSESCNETTNQCESSGDPCPDDGLFCNGTESCREAGNRCEHSGNPCPGDCDEVSGCI